MTGLKAQGSRLKVWPPASSLQPRAQSAFSLVEVVVSIAVLSVGLVGAIQVFPVGLRASQRAELVSRATIAAQRTIESLKLVSWGDLEAGESTSREESFDITVVVDQPDVEGLVDPTGLKRVTVTVSWTQEGRSRSLTVATYLHRATS